MSPLLGLKNPQNSAEELIKQLGSCLVMSEEDGLRLFSVYKASGALFLALPQGGRVLKTLGLLSY
jgi:hypothetical protein